MTSKSSKPLPYAALAILVAILFVEAVTEKDIELESYMPLLIAIGLGGAAKSAVEKAAHARKVMPDELSGLLKSEMSKLRPLIMRDDDEDQFNEIEKELPKERPPV